MNRLFVALAIVGILTTTLSIEAAEGPRVIKHALPAALEAGSRTSLSVVVANDGSVAWAPEEGFVFSYHWFDRAGETVAWDGRRSELPGVVEPGARVQLEVTVEAPLRPGDYFLQWDVVQEGVRWLSETDEVSPEAVPVSVFAGHAFTVVDGSAPPLMVAGSVTAVELVLKNDGFRTWRADGSFAASYHWLDRYLENVRSEKHGVYWEGRRSAFPAPVRENENVELGVVIVAPDKPGLWRLQWDLVEEGVCWFSDRLPEPLPTTWVLVVPDPLGDGFWWSLLTLSAAAAAVSVWRSGGPRTFIALFAFGDVMWCLGTVSVKQGIVLAEAGARPAAFGWLLIVAGTSALVLFSLLLPRRFRGWVCWTIAAGATLVMWADSIYIRFFGDLPSTAAIAGADQVGRVEASVRELLAPGDLWLWLDLLPGLVLVLVADRLRRSAGKRSPRVAIVGLSLMIAVGGAAAVRLALARPSLFGQVFRRVAIAEEVGVLNLHVVDSVRSVVGSVFHTELGAGAFAEVAAWFRDTAPQRAGVGESFGVAEGASLVMVQVESLQAFVIGCEVGGREVTPFLNRWTREGLWFSNLTDQTGQGRSSDSELETQTSLLPMAGGAAAFRYASNDFTGLAEALERRGYDTFSAVPYEGAFWNRRRTHPAYGFARSFFAEDFEAGEHVGWGLSDRDFLDQAAHLLKTVDRPFAAYLLTLSLHHPFEGFPAHLKELDLGAWEESDLGNYLHTMHFFDASLATFMAALKKEGLAENTVIAVWGDHDAGFPWRPEIATAMGASHDQAGWYLSQEVPLFIRVPGAEWLRGERTVPAGHTDVAPTLLALLGIDPAPYAFVGRNLLGEPGDRPVIGEYGCWRDSTHLFLQGDGSLSDGTCIELATMRSVTVAGCRGGYEAAMRTEEISALVLEHDLQRAIHDELVEESETNP